MKVGIGRSLDACGGTELPALRCMNGPSPRMKYDGAPTHTRGERAGDTKADPSCH